MNSSIINRDNVILIRIFTGIKTSIQNDNWDCAFNNLYSKLAMAVYPKRFVIEKIGVRKVCEMKWGITDIIDWLLDSDIHFILSHIHQGFISSSKHLNMDEVLGQLKRLNTHNGFPNGEALNCPVFTQNKILYLRALGNMANNTLCIYLKADISLYTENVLDAIKR